MSAIDSIRSIMYRIRWGSVIGVVLLFAVVYMIYTSSGVYDLIPTGYEVKDGVGIWADISPKKVAPGNSTVLEVEIKNMDSDKEIMLSVKGLSYDDNLFFDNTYSQSDSSDAIMMGPQAVRKISFKMKTKGKALNGKYPVDVTAVEVGKHEDGVKTRVFVEIEKSEE